MQVTLIVNPTAGDAAHETEKLVARLSRRGDEIKAVHASSRRLAAALRDPGDLVAAAGGDGTVAKVVRLLWRTSTPVLILPFGTANNIARSFGIRKAELDLDVVRHWRPQPVDAAEVDGEPIVESVGCGAVAHMIRESSKSKALPPFDYSVVSDEGERRGEAILIEVMAIARTGPRLQLAPETDPGDGLLDLVIAPPKSRPSIRSALRASGRRKIRGMTTIRGRSFTVKADTLWHFDDKPKRGGTRTVHVVPKAWSFLAP